MRSFRNSFVKLGVKSLVVLLASALMWSGLAACKKTPETKESLSSEGSSEVIDGGAVVVGVSQEPDFLDPYLAVAAGTKEIMYNVFEGLIKLGSDGEFVPGLATEWSWEDEGKALKFTLREKVQFHDGSSMEAEDVVHSLKRASGLLDGTAYIPALDIVDSVEASDDGKTITVGLEDVRPEILIYFVTASILPSDLKDPNQNPIGTGPFVFDAYRPQQDVKLTRFKDYWGEKAHIERVTFAIVASLDSAMLELQAGAIDIYPYLTASKTEQLKDGFNILSGSSGMTQLMALNNAVAPLDQPEVRKALNLAIDRQAVIDLVGDGHAAPIFSALSPVMKGAFDPELTTEAKVEEAKKLLEKADLKDGFELTVTVPSNYTYHMDTASVISSQLEAIGVKVKIEPVNWGTWLEKVYSGREFQATVIALTPEFSPLDAFARFRSDAADNFVNFSSAEFDKLYQEAERDLDVDARNERYKKMQGILFDGGASVFISDPHNVVAVDKDLGGYTFYPKYVQDMASVYYTDQAEADRSLER